MRNKHARLSALSLSLALASPSVSAKTLVEDFTDISQCDFTTTTGLWNTKSGRAQAAIVAGSSEGAVGDVGLATREVDFGNGELGHVTSSTGFNFNTNTHPNGFNFKSLLITGGSITVSGNNPLVIRSQGDVLLNGTLSVNGGDGGAGLANTGANASGGAGGTPRGGAGAGGDGGGLIGGLSQPGSSSLTPANVADAAGGAANGPNAGAVSSNTVFLQDFDLATFFAGGGGGGGGRHTTQQHTGGGGGAGGGAIRISALGEVTTQLLTARGGDGGMDAGTVAPNCSGAGAPGIGGSIWVQAVEGANINSEPNVTGGTVSPTCSSTIPQTPGDVRVDTPGLFTVPGTWVTVSPARHDLVNAAPSQSYIVQSKTYDLATLNPKFTAAPTVTQTLNGGTITVEYAGSKDDQTYTAFDADITTLSDQQMRYLKVRITIQTAAGSNPSPVVSQLSIPFTELGVPTLDISYGFGLGCSPAVNAAGSTRPLVPTSQTKYAILTFGAWMTFFGLIWRFSRKLRN